MPTSVVNFSWGAVAVLDKDAPEFKTLPFANRVSTQTRYIAKLQVYRVYSAGLAVRENYNGTTMFPRFHSGIEKPEIDSRSKGFRVRAFNPDFSQMMSALNYELVDVAVNYQQFVMVPECYLEISARGTILNVHVNQRLSITAYWFLTVPRFFPKNTKDTQFEEVRGRLYDVDVPKKLIQVQLRSHGGGYLWFSLSSITKDDMTMLTNLSEGVVPVVFAVSPQFLHVNNPRVLSPIFYTLDNSLDL